MCMEIKIKCNCGKEEVRFNLKNNIMPVETIEKIYCPEESRNINFNEKTMINDNGWVIEYNMDVAKYIGSKVLNLSPDEITPEFLFDEGYITWKELYPGEQKDSQKERERLQNLAKTDRKKYFQEIRNWANERMKRLKEQGWRKAQAAV